MKKILTLLILVVIVAGLTVFGTSPQQKTYADPVEKFGKGVLNTGFGWTEVPRAVLVDGPRDQGWWSIIASPYNCAVGILKATSRTGGGAVDTATFPIGESLVEDYPLQE